MRTRALTLLSIVLLVSGVHAQSFLIESLEPGWVSRAGAISSYISSDRLATIERQQGDKAAIDMIFSHALAVSGGDIGEALFACTAACFDHHTIYFKLVFFKMPFPLSFESDSAYHARYAHLPSRLFYDTPPEGDRDKLQHFFGSAYLEWALHSHTFTTAIGNGLEVLEPALVVGGENDERDKRANKAGIAFAMMLDRHPGIRPSMILNLIR
jgi:hypothetical protein